MTNASLQTQRSSAETPPTIYSRLFENVYIYVGPGSQSFTVESGILAMFEQLAHCYFR